MGMDFRLSVCFFVVWSVGSVAQQTDAPSETSFGFPECVRVEEKCRSALSVCTDVPVSLTARHIKDNLLCIANDVSTIYRLRGCPIGYYDQSTSGVCRTPNGNNGTDLLLTSDELEPGLHSFDCVIDSSALSASTHVVVANDSMPFRVVQVLVNDVLQDRNNTSFDLYVDDNITVIVVAVGSVLNVSANEERFNCEIGFPCNDQSSEVADRYLACWLGSPANMSDDGRVLRILLDSVELRTISINMNERPLSPPSEDDNSQTTTTATATAAAATTTTTTTVTTTATITPTTTAATATNTTATTSATNTSASTVASATVTQMPVVTSIITSPVTTVSTSIVTASVIPSLHVDRTATGHNATPTGTATDKTPHEKSFSVVAIAVITGSVSGCIVLVGVLLIVYCKCKKCKKTRASKKTIGAAPSPHKVLSYPCPHCDELDEGIIKAGGYAIQKLPKNRSTGSYKEECKFSSEENVPVIVCGRPECQAQSWLESSPMPENYNILQLHVAGDGDETPVQCNQRVKVISCPSPDDGPPVTEVLQWLNNVSRRGSITSLDGQVKEIRKGVNVLQKLVMERTSEIIEKQDQTNTTINALHIDAQYERQE